MENSTPTIKPDRVFNLHSGQDEIPMLAWQQLGQMAREDHGVVMWAMLDTTYEPQAVTL